MMTQGTKVVSAVTGDPSEDTAAEVRDKQRVRGKSLEQRGQSPPFATRPLKPTGKNRRDVCVCVCVCVCCLVFYPRVFSS